MFNNLTGTIGPRPMWTKLQSICQQAGQGYVLATLDRMLNEPAAFKQRGFKMGIPKQTGKTIETVNKLQNAIADPNELWDAVTGALVLQGLLSKYDYIKSSILINGNKDLTEIQSILGAEQVQIVRDKELGVMPDLAMRSAQAGEGKCFTCGRTNHYQKDCFHNPLSKNYKGKVPQRGKWRATVTNNDNCQSKSRGRSTRGRAHKMNSKDNETEDDNSERDVAQLLRGSEPIQTRKGVWYIDSCCTRHLINNQAILDSIKRQSIAFETAKKEEVLQAAEVGMATLLLPNGHELRLPGVAYVPNAADNLISLARLKESGVTYYDHKEGMLFKQWNRLIMLAKQDHNLYSVKVNGREVAMGAKGQPTYLLGTTLDDQLWHRRFGHASHARVAQARRKVDGISPMNQEEGEDYSSSSETTPNIDNNTPEISNVEPGNLAEVAPMLSAEQRCEPCVVSKQMKIVQHKPMRPTKCALERVYADLWGPHYPSLLKESTYAGGLIDDYTQKSWVLFLPSKDAFADAFKLWVAEVEQECERKLQHLCIDGGGEFISMEFQKFCERRGTVLNNPEPIKLELSTPYSHEENRVVERMWRTIDTLKNAMLHDSGLPN